MKKILSWFLYITCILTLVACGKKQRPLRYLEPMRSHLLI